MASCVFIEKERHGHCSRGKPSPEYVSWASMKQRCRDPRTAGYAEYGGRGITYCDRWKRFSNFLEDMGPRPDGTTIERKDPNGNYEPDNCKWGTQEEQSNNRRNSRRITIGEETKTQAQWARANGMSTQAFRYRLNAGKSVIESLAKPIKAAPRTKYELDGESLTLTQWAARLGTHRMTIVGRLRTGWSLREALTTPVIYKR